MRLYVLVCFWLGIACFVLRCVEIATREKWPKVLEQSLGFVVALTLLGIGSTLWAGIVLWCVE